MHSKLARGSALVALILLKNGEDEALLEFAHTFGVKDVALVHLQNECFQLIFHGGSLSRSISFRFNFVLSSRPRFRLGCRSTRHILRSTMQEIQTLVEPCP